MSDGALGLQDQQRHGDEAEQQQRNGEAPHEGASQGQEASLRQVPTHLAIAPRAEEDERETEQTEPDPQRDER